MDKEEEENEEDDVLVDEEEEENEEDDVLVDEEDGGKVEDNMVVVKALGEEEVMGEGHPLEEATLNSSLQQQSLFQRRMRDLLHGMPSNP